MSCDPLTGLDDDAAFRAALGACRATSIALLTIEPDLSAAAGPQARDRLLRETAARLAIALRAGDALFRTDDRAFTAIVHVSDDAEAADVARRLAAAAPQTSVSLA
jgi:GGDEF domain-containing protein